MPLHTRLCVENDGIEFDFCWAFVTRKASGKDLNGADRKDEVRFQLGDVRRGRRNAGGVCVRERRASVSAVGGDEG